MPNLLYAIPCVLLAATGGAVWLALYFRRNRQRPGAGWFAWAILSCGVWTLLDALSYLVANPATQDLARRAAWPAILAATITFFRFACAYAQRASWWRIARFPLLGATLVEMVLIATNPFHLLVWRESQRVTIAGVQMVSLVPGPAVYWLHLPITYGAVLGGVAALFAHVLESPAFYLRRVMVLSAGMVAPLVANMLVIARLTRGIDLTPIALLVAFAAVTWVTFHGRLLDVMPAVRRLLFQQHRDGVFVLDGESRVVEVNPAAQRLLGRNGVVLGTPIASLLPFWERVKEGVQAGDGRSVEVTSGGAVLDVRALLIRDEQRRTIGRLIVLHDVTERAQLIRELDAYARTVAHDLKNPLSTAIGYLELVHISEPQLDEGTARQLAGADQVCQQMAGIIDDLLRRGSVRSTWLDLPAVAQQRDDLRMQDGVTGNDAGK